MYQIIIRTPDNSDGIYQGERLVVDERTLNRAGIELFDIIHYSQEQLTRLVDWLGK